VPKKYSNIPQSADGFVISQHLASNAPILFVCLNDASLKNIQKQLEFFAPNHQIITIPAWDCLPYDRTSPKPTIIAQRVAGFTELAQGNNNNQIILTTINSLLQKTAGISTYKTGHMQLKTGDNINREELTKFLINNGYQRSGKVIEPAEFAIRGSIIDIYPTGYQAAIRLDFFGDEIEQIRAFDPLTQKTNKTIDSINLIKAHEVPINETIINILKNNYRRSFGIAADEDILYPSISSGHKHQGYEHCLPFFTENTSTLFNFLPTQTTIIFEHLAQQNITDRLDIIDDYYQARLEQKQLNQGNIYNPVEPDTLFLDADNLHAQLQQHNSVYLSQFSEGEDIYNLNKLLNIEDTNLQARSDKIKSLFKLNNHKKVIIGCNSAGSLETTITKLKDYELYPRQISKIPVTKGPHIAVLPLEAGFYNDDYLFISQAQIFGQKHGSTKRRQKSIEEFMAEANNFTNGEYIVHENHGIGRFDGLETLTLNGISHDMLKLTYLNDDKLFVPVENIELITRFGEESEHMRLDKLGSASWSAKKAKLKERIKLAADELLNIAAARELQQAPDLSPEQQEYNEFCNSFPFVETEDQLKAIDDIRADLIGGKPTERLICGDVGFGKTEVAMRAAFMAASAGHQVAIVAPTTLLTRQHYINFVKRFEGFAYEIRQLSRMVSAKDAKQTKQAMAEGKIDIVIGTHALIAEDIEFKNLGLTIIDEEQHFGVAQKEKLKKLKAQTHVISISATPIPRTLQMAMSGVREISLIATPPVDRLAVRSFVMPFDDLVIREAIIREYGRGGQIYFVVPRIKDLREIRERIEKLVPEIKMQVAHGQLTPAELDKVMNDFYDNKFDLLLATAIVESGLDVSNANTMIIHKADMFGLSQLYQLRGRVGRGKVRGYCYLTTRPLRRLSKPAQKRLEVMQNLDSLGAGFTVASHDMDIRGAGNLLGDEQSGHIKEVGIELYQQMLKEAVAKAKAMQNDNDNTAQIDDNWSPNINLGMSVLIPEEYVDDLDLRLGLYRRAARLDNDEKIDEFSTELVDRFGPMPQEVENFLQICRLKDICKKAGITKIDSGSKAITIAFKQEAIQPEKLLTYVMQNSDKAKLKPDGRIIFKVAHNNVEERISFVKFIAVELAGL